MASAHARQPTRGHMQARLSGLAASPIESIPRVGLQFVTLFQNNVAFLLYNPLFRLFTYSPTTQANMGSSSQRGSGVLWCSFQKTGFGRFWQGSGKICGKKQVKIDRLCWGEHLELEFMLAPQLTLLTHSKHESLTAIFASSCCEAW